ncbi:P-loop containing nucleoside triphosphate hydrolase [Lasallia pustulata]|uniref:p-loop containing nucleoside triphosphate hydrolase n=1 Tax=Lasallia pustulata TaxID=136370 RepID=A0A1W5CSP9_9LECA|nr:P-loop containing nucleoside triphosphate hydrolase [Lasallia pustulata]
MAEQDVSNFSSPLSHRLPTVSASQALHNLTSSRSKAISTGLKRLDALLQGREPTLSSQSALPGGLSRSQVTEVYGPPGVGKTTFAMQTCASALHAGNAVVWVDAAQVLVGSRLKDVLAGLRLPDDHGPPSSPAVARSMEDFLDQFHHFTCPTLPHLLALLTHPSPSFPPENTSLIIVDSISTLFATAFPRAIDSFDSNQTSAKKNDAVQWAASRRWSVMGDLISKLGKLAATRYLTILLTSQTATRVRADTGAVLHPSISGTAWDGGISNRIVLYRDWLTLQEGDGSSQGKEVRGARFAGVVKASGVLYSGLGRVVPFTVEKYGLQELEISADSAEPGAASIISAPPLKRKRDQIADSQSEDEDAGSEEEFGWADDDHPLVPEDFTEEHLDSTNGAHDTLFSVGAEAAEDIKS